jgi:LmbE family N-acetylglucosaminyl deacetylase
MAIGRSTPLQLKGIMTSHALVVAAHPDDEVLGCGGTMNRLEREHWNVGYYICGSGRNTPFDNAFDALPRLHIIRQIEDTIRSFGPHVIYTHSKKDLNIDHQIVSDAVLTACRPYAIDVRAIYSFETVSATECNFNDQPFRPTRFVEILQEDLIAKCHILQTTYRDEMRSFPHPRSIEAITNLAKWRGAQSGYRLAEAYEVIYERESL